MVGIVHKNVLENAKCNSNAKHQAAGDKDRTDSVVDNKDKIIQQDCGLLTCRIHRLNSSTTSKPREMALRRHSLMIHHSQKRA